MQPTARTVLVAALAAVVAVAITVGVMFATMKTCHDNKPPVPPPPPPPTPTPPHLEDPMRPVYHYTPTFGWVNDPNGLVYYKGEWHLFYQYDFESTHHGNMSWGHAVSADLVHWQELPVAIRYNLEEQIFSGSVVVDSECTSGLCSPAGHPVLVAFFTSFQQQGANIQSQHIAYSTDGLGREWIKYSNNPVLDKNNPEYRDPRVQRFGNEWLMLVQRSTDHVMEFHKSKDLIHWEETGTFGPTGFTDGVWECPDIFPLYVDGNPNEVKWVLIININPGQRIIGSAGQFWIGEFDGTKFVPDGESTWLDWGMDNYATITWDNAPERISLGWMSNWNYTELAPTGEGFRNSFTTPRNLMLKKIDGQVKLTQMPVSSLASLRVGPPKEGDDIIISAAYSSNIRGHSVDIEATFINTGGSTEFGVRVYVGEVQETLIGYDVANQEAFVDRRKSGTVDFHDRFADVRHSAPLKLGSENKLKLRVMVDRGSVEAFFNDGEIAITDVIFPDFSKDRIDFYTTGGQVTIESYNVWNMKSFHDKK